VVALALAAGPAAAQSPAGQITGQVTDAAGTPLAGITVAAAPVSSPDAITLTTTDAAGDYTLELAPGAYDVAFNSVDPIDDGHDSVTYGGPGPGPGAVCTVCGGQAVTVAAGATTAGIGARLASPPFPPTGFLRPLSGKAIRVVGGLMSFRVGCHIEPNGCLGVAHLRLGHRAGGPIVASVRVAVAPGAAGRLVFRIPAGVLARLRRARHHALAALVDITAPPSHTITRFSLIDR
jgi:hypothetical protein